jgi:hypothetical protein
VITSGVPATPTSDDASHSNGNTRCQYWKWLKFDLNPTKTSTLTSTMGTMGYANVHVHTVLAMIAEFSPLDIFKGCLFVSLGVNILFTKLFF